MFKKYLRPFFLNKINFCLDINSKIDYSFFNLNKNSKFKGAEMELIALKIRLEKMKKVSEMDLSVLNEKISKIEKDFSERIKRVEEFAKKENVSISINGNYALSVRIKEELGVYLSPSYVKSFNDYTARIEKKYLLWYQLRDQFLNFYSLANSQILSNRIKTKYSFDKEDKNVKVIREFKNGYSEYEKTQEILEVVLLAKHIREIFEPTTK